MKIFLDKVNYEIARATKYLESSAKHPEGFRVQIESLQDSVSLFHIVAEKKIPRNSDLFTKVLMDAQLMLQNLKLGLILAETEEKFAGTASSPNFLGVKSTVQYPLIEIPKFSGDDPLKFRPFMALFMNRINCNFSLIDVEKFILLKNYLKDEAFDVINEIPVMEENFSLALNLLEEMYGAKDRCIDTLYKRMKTLPVASTGEISELRKTYWKFEAILRSLEQYDIQVDENLFVGKLYSAKFPNLAFVDNGNFQTPRLSEIRKQIYHIIQVKEQVSEHNSFEMSVSNADSGQSAVFANEIKQPETAFTYQNKNSVTSEEIILCIFCSENHFSEDCTVYSTVYERKMQIRDLCWKCLQVKHPVEPCMQLQKCEYCNENSHNRILCPEKCRTVGVSSGTLEKLSTSLSSVLLKNTRPTTNESLTDDCSFYPTTSLTTCATLEWPKSGKTTSARLVIASGCPINLISDSVALRLGMKLPKKSIVLLNATGEISRATAETATVLIHVPNTLPVPVKVHIIKKVCDKKVFAPTVAEFKRAHPHLVDMDFPDTGNGRPIEILIGGDSNLSAVGFNCGLNGEICPPLNSGWSLVSSQFGWLIVGTDTSNEPVIFSFTIRK